MTRVELLDLILNGENSYVEFKRDDVHPASLAKEMSALLNQRGGAILLGVEDNGEISGISEGNTSTEERVMNIAQNNIQPSVIPDFLSIKMDDNRSVGIIKLSPDTSSKPYRALRSNMWVTYVRVGSTSREATRTEEVRLYQSAGLVNYETKPVLNTRLESLDLERIANYFQFILEISVPPHDETHEWEQLLLNSDLLVETDNGICVSIAGLLLFGKNPNRRLKQAGVTAVVFPGTEKDYNTTDEETIRGPLVPLYSENRSVIGSGLIDRSVDFVRRNMESVAWLEGGRRQQKKVFPIDAVREAIVNAIIHRDYTHEGTDIELSMYEDRLEIISPGRLPNGVTVEKMKRGVIRVIRNQFLTQFLRDCRYIEHFGLGVRKRIIQSMQAHNGTDPDLIEEEDRFKVCLWKSPRSSQA